MDPAGRLVAANGRARAFLGIAQADRSAFADLEPVRYSEVIGRQTARGPASIVGISVSGLRFAARSGPAADPRPLPPAARPQQMQGSPHVEAKNASALALLSVVTADQQTERAFANARRAMDRDVPVVLVGETGTGKELFARALHISGPRSRSPVRRDELRSTPGSLIEGELFGYGDGAFTGAKRGGAAGKIESADGGTLFLDEIGDMPLSLQTRLLRIFAGAGGRSAWRGSKVSAFDIALVCATNQDLRDLVARRLFREDFYYRINGLRVTLPPFRERTNILQLAQYFLWYPDRFERGLVLSEAAK